MSQNHFNNMSGVPVKIAEAYKPPKKLAMNQNVAQRMATESNQTTQLLAIANAYDFSLERNILAKMSEWQHLRDRDNCDRKERLRCYQKEHQRQFDAKQKQILTSVSYPSADDLSSSSSSDDGDDDDDDDEDDDDDDDGEDSGRGTLSDRAMQPKVIPQQQRFSPPNSFDNILVPTVAVGQNGSGNVTTIKPHTKINLQEFENDTYTPFDNIELKTINDLDVLAEVWNSSAAINTNTNKLSNHNPANEIVSMAANDSTSHSRQITVDENAFNQGTTGIDTATHMFDHSTAQMPYSTSCSSGRNNNNNSNNNLYESKAGSTASTPNSSQAQIPNEHYTLFRQLSVSSQNLAKNISSMGFPIERVARVVDKFGKDDKKIIEHLIPMGELAALGFDEQKISDALEKFDNDKTKALDSLIS